MENENFVLSSPLNSFLWKRERGATGKIRRKFSLFFFLKFPLFFFLITLLFFSFGERNWKIGRIKMCAPNTLNKICKNRIFVLATLIYPVQGKNLYPRHEIFWIAKLKRPYFVERRNEVFFASEMTLKVRISSLFLPF